MITLPKIIYRWNLNKITPLGVDDRLIQTRAEVHGKPICASRDRTRGPSGYLLRMLNWTCYKVRHMITTNRSCKYPASYRRSST